MIAVHTARRGGLVVMFTMTGITHFVVLRNDLIAMVPPGFPAPELLVTITGVLELAMFEVGPTTGQRAPL